MLIGNVYVQANDPSAVGFGYFWANSSTGDLYARNTSNTAWVKQGNLNQAQGGSLARTGGTMTGAIAGVSGWAPEDSPDFTTSAKLGGVNLATVNDLSNLQTTLTDIIDAKIAAALSAQGITSDVVANTAIGTGVLTFSYPTLTDVWADTQTIPLPSFPDGQPASEAQCKWIVAPVYIESRGEDLLKGELKFMSSGGVAQVDPMTTRTFTAGHYEEFSTVNRIKTVKIAYIVIARR